MEFDLSWILLGLPLAFILGWVASRMDLRQLRLENRQTPKAYFKGLNYLLNEQQDQAIDAFIEAVQHDPDTSELHFALGNLFRRRGEYERAVRVHQHLLSRGDLSQADRDRAQHALALDYLKAGLLDRAEDALSKLEGTAHEAQAHLALLSIYERSRDWAKASVIAQKLSNSGQGSFQGRLAHYLCEEAESLDVTQHTNQVVALLKKATWTSLPIMTMISTNIPSVSASYAGALTVSKLTRSLHMRNLWIASVTERMYCGHLIRLSGIRDLWPRTIQSIRAIPTMSLC
jgi:lipopolysaccharide biosynthesis regulator YciM